MASAGLCEDQIALRANGMHKTELRRKYIDDIKEGRAVAKAAREEAEAAKKITATEYHFLNACTLTFSLGDWFDSEGRSLLFLGTDGEGARTVEDAFAQWKADGGRFLCTGLSSDFDKKKYAEFAKVVLAYRQKLKGDEHGAASRRH
jgi:hypothetical protein